MIGQVHRSYALLFYNKIILTSSINQYLRCAQTQPVYLYIKKSIFLTELKLKVKMRKCKVTRIQLTLVTSFLLSSLPSFTRI